MGSADPRGKMDKKIKKRKHVKKQFSEWWVGRAALCRPHIYSDILQNAPFRSQIFFASGARGHWPP